MNFTMLHRSPHSPPLAEQGSIKYLTDRVENLNLNWVDKSKGCMLLFACWVVMARKDCSSFYCFRRRTLTYTLSSFPFSTYTHTQKKLCGGVKFNIFCCVIVLLILWLIFGHNSLLKDNFDSFCFQKLQPWNDIFRIAKQTNPLKIYLTLCLNFQH